LYAQKRSGIDEFKDICEEVGFTPDTDEFAKCVDYNLKQMDKD
jgi:hypothetical protein